MKTVSLTSKEIEMEELEAHIKMLEKRLERILFVRFVFFLLIICYYINNVIGIVVF